MNYNQGNQYGGHPAPYRGAPQPNYAPQQPTYNQYGGGTQMASYNNNVPCDPCNVPQPLPPKPKTPSVCSSTTSCESVEECFSWCRLFQKSFVEFLAVTFLVWVVVTSTVLVHQRGANFTISNTNLAIGAALMVAVYFSSNISGGHVNPAVTFGHYMRIVFTCPLACCLCGKRDKKGRKQGCQMPTECKQLCSKTWMYILFQLLGSIIGALLALVSVEDVGFKGVNLDDPKKGAVQWQKTALCELVGTFFLVFVVLTVATEMYHRGGYKNNGFFALAIGFTVVAAGIAVSDISADFNPAVTFGIALVKAYTKAYVNIGLLFYKWMCQIIGSFLAALVFHLVNKDFSKRD